MKALIAAGGEYRRWGNYLGVPKWLAAIEGETLVGRSVRLLKERGVEDVSIVGTHERLHELGVPVIEPVNALCTDLNKIFSSRQHWGSEQTLILFGDVWFSDAAMDKIVATPSHKNILFFARLVKSKLTGHWREIFALRFAASLHKELGTICRVAANNGKKRAWNLVPLSRKIRMISIDDWTDDFDFPADYERWIARWARRQSS